MKTNNVKISYDHDADVLSWETSRKDKIDYASEVGDVVVHFTKENKPVYVELLNASQFHQKSARLMEHREKLLVQDKGKRKYGIK